MASNQKVRRIVLTGAVTVITIAGSLYGAGIKTGQQVTQVLLFSNHYIQRLLAIIPGPHGVLQALKR